MIHQMKRIKAVMAILLLSFSSTQALPQAVRPALPDAAEVDAFIQEGMEQLNAPGGAVGLVEDGMITHLRGFGKTDQSGGLITPQTPFQIASVTKSFTSLIVLQLEGEGKLSIDDPVIRYIPDFSTADRNISDAITIRNLMNHRSGLSTLDGNRYQRSLYRGDDAAGQAVKRLGSAQLEGHPGGSYQYSNANYATLAHLIETIEQAPFEQVLEGRIFSVLGMKNSFVQITSKPVAAEAIGHIQWFGIPFEEHFIASRMMMAAGGVTTSAEDLAKYLIAISENDPRIVPVSLTESWAKGHERAYEFGWEHDTVNGQKIIFHDGANPGFRSILMYNLETRKGGLFLMNMSGTLDGNLHYGTVRYALGLPGTDISTSQIFVYLLWGSALILAALTASCIYSISKLRRAMAGSADRSPVVKWASILMPGLCLIGYAFTLWFYVPRSFGVDFSAASLFFPDLGLLLALQIFVAVIWAGMRGILLARRDNLSSVPKRAGPAIRSWSVR